MKRGSNRLASVLATWFATVALLGAASAQNASEDRGPQTGPEVEQFESKVRPLLVQHCYECHSSESARPKGRLRVDSRAALLLGGLSGPALEPGDVERSLLIEALRYSDEIKMPPSGKLDDAEIALFEEWVRRGAAFPESAAGEALSEDSTSSGSHAATAEELWSFQPISDAPPPALEDDSWCVNEVDLFVRARHAALALAPAPRADRRTLLRRLSIDLVGLPPTADELDRFEHDARPDAWLRQIDRLLESPHYGERWGRYWLDLARYADSNGLDENLAMSHAWRYRDWVVRALNDDLPYDQFATWQLAGDLLPEPDDAQQLADQLTATGFLVLGPKMLAEQDKEKLAVDVVDEQMDVASRTFLGLTMGCARCHDHKFDPISQRDYYALAGVFKSTATMANFNFVSGWNERELGRAAEIEARREHVAKLEKARQELETLRNEVDEALRRTWTSDTGRYMLAAARAARRAIVIEAEEQSRGNLIVDSDQYGSAEVVVTRTGVGGRQFTEFDLTFTEPGPRVIEVRLAAKDPRPVRVLLDGELASESALGETTGSWNPDGQRWLRVGIFDLHAGRNVLRFEREGAVPHFDKLALVDAPAGGAALDWSSADNPWAVGLAPELVRAWTLSMIASERREDPVFALWHAFARLDTEGFEDAAAELAGSLRTRRDAQDLKWNAHVLGLLDGLPPTSLRELAGRYQALFSAADAAWRERRSDGDAKVAKLDDAALDALRLVLQGDASPLRLTTDSAAPYYSEFDRARVAQAQANVDELEAATPPEFERALAVRDADEIAELPIFRRGSHLDRDGEPVPRSFFSALSPLAPSPAIGADSSGRLEFARWLFDSRNPLTARVIVNRIWQGHFGRGLVASSSNFGARGDAPTDAALLDWLALEMQRRDWSLKAMHRLICASATYQMATGGAADARERDPENLACSRTERRRLDVEALRDSLLAIAGQLDRSLGGSLLTIADRAYATNDQSNDQARYDAPRRSLYLPVIRNAMFDMFTAFDYPDASMTVDARPTTTSPAQALFLMNSPLLHSASRALAESTAALADPRERVTELYRRVLLRAPDERESTRALAFVFDAPPAEPPPVASNVGGEASMATTNTRDVWSELAHVLLSCNEFLYVD